MLPFEFIVDGPPLSHQTRNRRRLHAWKQTVQFEARKSWPQGEPPLTIPLQITVVYYHDAITINLDNDNMVKPIQDALKGLVYVDDKQITDIRVRKTNLDGAIRVRGMPATLAEGFSKGTEFLHIRIENAPDHTELL